MERKELIRTIYLYLFSLIGLVLIIIGSVRLVDLGLKAFIFTKAEEPLVYPVYPKSLRESAMPGEKATALTPEEEEKYRREQEDFESKTKQSNRERTAANSLAMIIVGTPIFLYHWKVIQKKKNTEMIDD